MICFGNVPAGSVLPIMFGTYGKTNGESITLTGLAVTDIEVYKGTSMTQRASDAGYTLLDTDGIDIDGVTGIHGFSIDTGDNTDASFYAAGSFYTVVVSAVTVDSQTVNFVAATFRIVAAENTAGTPSVDAVRLGGTAQTGRDIGASVLLSSGTGTGQVKLSGGYVAPNWGDIGNPTTTVGLSGTTVKTATDVETDTADIQARLPESLVGGRINATVNAISGDTAAADALEAMLDGTGGVTITAAIAGNITGNLSGSVGSVTAGVTVTTNNDKTGYSLSTTPPTAAAIADAVWDEAIADHLTGGTTGAALNGAGSAGDPWGTAVPGAYSAGTAGYILGTNLNATVSSRLASASYTAPLDAAGTRSAVGLASANLDTQLDALPTAAENATAVLTTQMTESYATDGTAPTLAQAQFMIWSFLAERSISSVTLTAKKLDGSTTAMTFTLNDGTTPTAITRAT